jgi:hypothetical protein
MMLTAGAAARRRSVARHIASTLSKAGLFEVALKVRCCTIRVVNPKGQRYTGSAGLSKLVTACFNRRRRGLFVH